MTPTHSLGNITWVYNDGGREVAGFRGRANDCVCRAITIATGLSYRDVYGDLNNSAQQERRRDGYRSSARLGVFKATYKQYLARLGWVWVPTMRVGQGCTVHLRADQLPGGPLIVSVSRHLTTMMYGVVHDTRDPTRGGTRCVYGYWTPGSDAPVNKL